MSDSSINEIRLILQNLTEIVERNHDENIEQHKIILVKQKETNGRLGSLEQWRTFIMGGLAVLSVLIIPIFIKLIIDK